MAQLTGNGFLANSLIGDFTDAYRQQQSAGHARTAIRICAVYFRVRCSISAKPRRRNSAHRRWLMRTSTPGKTRGAKNARCAGRCAGAGSAGNRKTTVIGEVITSSRGRGKPCCWHRRRIWRWTTRAGKIGSVPDIRAIWLGRRQIIRRRRNDSIRPRAGKIYQSLADAAETQFLNRGKFRMRN